MVTKWEANRYEQNDRILQQIEDNLVKSIAENSVNQDREQIAIAEIESIYIKLPEHSTSLSKTASSRLYEFKDMLDRKKNRAVDREIPSRHEQLRYGHPQD